MLKRLTFSVLFILFISGCAANKQEIDEQELIKQQQYCADLSKEINDLRGKPVRRTELRRRYDIECAPQY